MDPSFAPTKLRATKKIEGFPLKFIHFKGIAWMFLPKKIGTKMPKEKSSKAPTVTDFQTKDLWGQ